MASWCTEWTRGTVEGLLVYANAFQRHSVQKTGVSGTERKFCAKKGSLVYGVQFIQKSAAPEAALFGA